MFSKKGGKRLYLSNPMANACKTVRDQIKPMLFVIYILITLLDKSVTWKWKTDASKSTCCFSFSGMAPQRIKPRVILRPKWLMQDGRELQARRRVRRWSRAGSSSEILTTWGLLYLPQSVLWDSRGGSTSKQASTNCENLMHISFGPKL